MIRNRISYYIRNCLLLKLKCRKCGHAVTHGLDAMLELSRKSDDLDWWRRRFACAECGEKNPYLSLVQTHLTTKKYRSPAEDHLAPVD